MLCRRELEINELRGGTRGGRELGLARAFSVRAIDLRGARVGDGGCTGRASVGRRAGRRGGRGLAGAVTTRTIGWGADGIDGGGGALLSALIMLDGVRRREGVMTRWKTNSDTPLSLSRRNALEQEREAMSKVLKAQDRVAVWERGPVAGSLGERPREDILDYGATVRARVLIIREPQLLPRCHQDAKPLVRTQAIRRVHGLDQAGGVADEDHGAWRPGSTSAAIVI